MGMAEDQNLAARCNRCTFVNGGGNPSVVVVVLASSVFEESVSG